MACIDFGFSHFGMNRIGARCLTTKVASERVLRKIGMQNPGPGSTTMPINGIVQEVRIYVITRVDASDK